MSATPYPVTVTAQLDPDVSRGLWLVKWILAIPHYVLLLVLWATFAILSIVAFIAILFTGRYPRNVFDFNVGVMRWTWRVTYYAYGALGTDRYPPFTLAEVPSYPAHLDVVYPEHLSRKLVLVKWWLLALPHYFVVALFAGGGFFALDASSQDSGQLLWGGGVIGILVLVGAVTLLVSGKYPKPVFDLIIGLQRWVIRVAGYAALMTDVYPPFRLDQGGEVAAVSTDGASASPAGHTPGTPPARVVVPYVLGSLALLVAAVLGLSSAALLVADHTVSDKDGFLMSPTMTYRSESHAITSEAVDLGHGYLHRMGPDDVFGVAKLVVSPTDDGPPLFVGVAPTADVDQYLDGVSRSTLVSIERTNGRTEPKYRESAGGAPASEPGRQDFWTDSSEGRGDQSISFQVESGSWTVVVMRIDGSRGVAADLRAGVTFPALGWLVAALLTGTGIFLLVGLALIIAGTRASHHRRSAGGAGDVRSADRVAAPV